MTFQCNLDSSFPVAEYIQHVHRLLQAVLFPDLALGASVLVWQPKINQHPMNGFAVNVIPQWGLGMVLPCPIWVGK